MATSFSLSLSLLLSEVTVRDGIESLGLYEAFGRALIELFPSLTLIKDVFVIIIAAGLL